MDIIQVPVSPGEVLDKITILEIKSERISDAGKLANVKRELELLQASWQQSVIRNHIGDRRPCLRPVFVES